MKRFTLISLVLVGSYLVSAQYSAKDKKSFPKVSEDAKVVLNLVSNVEKTKWTVDGKLMGTSERLRVMVNKKEHTVIAEPEGYNPKKEYIQPPYANNVTSMRITFMIQDKIKTEQVTAGNTGGGNPNSSSAKNATIISEVDKNIPTSGKTHPYRFALIIGNEDYSTYQTDLTNEIDVDFAAKDASVFKEYVQKTLGVPENNITLLTNATAGQMRQSLAKLNKLAEKTAGKAEIYFYYAGHGLPDEVTKEAYLIPVDVAGTNVQYGIKVTDVYKTLTEHPTEKVTVFLDACFSGGARNQGLLAARGVKVKPKKEQLAGKLVVFSASSGDQSSLPYKAKGHGIFTYFLLKKLQESGGDLTYKELSDYIKENVSLQSVVINSKEQDPQTNVSPSAASVWAGWPMN